MIDKNENFGTSKLFIIITLICYWLIAFTINHLGSRKHEHAPSIECAANMGTLHSAMRMYYFENARSTVENNITISIDGLIKKKYLTKYPVCPTAKGLSKEIAYYKIIDKPGQKLDIECVNNDDPKNAHGSYLKRMK
ncbi:MAG TPA: hypothetical protein PK467_10185 [Candidatus Wallbacteria bacterium]|nr:hypothetical protein [Candidatus Wallbacteria bacterium]